MSRFITNAILKALEEKNSNKEKELGAAYYEAANQDSDRTKSLLDWNELDDTSDLIDEAEDWNWLRNSNEETEKLKHG